MSAIGNFLFEAASSYSGVTRKVVRGGIVVRRPLKRKKKVLSSKRRLALRVAQRKARLALQKPDVKRRALKRRRKALRIRKRYGLDKGIR